MEQRNGSLLDVSSLLLVEGGADSEADYGILKLYLDVSAMGASYDHGHDADDAESCSCDTSTDRKQDFGEGYEMDDQEHCCDFGVADDHDHNVNLQYWSSAYKMFSRDAALGYMNATVEGDQEESKVDTGNRSRKVMDAMEDRLFWETCMAAGYP